MAQQKSAAYIAVQKAASTSISSLLRGHPKINVYSHSYSYECGAFSWDNVYTNETNETTEPELWSDRFSIINIDQYDIIWSVVRNPFEIFTSYYFHHHQDGGQPDGWAFCNRIHDFNSFQDFKDAYLDDGFEWHLPPMKRSMFSLLKDEEGSWITDFVYNIEDLDSLNEFFETFGKAGKLGLSNKTKQKPKDIVGLYSDSEVKKLKELWCEDLELFGYTI